MTKKKTIQVKLVIYTMEDVQDFEPNFMLLNEICVTATVITPVAITHKQPKCKLAIKK